MRILLILSLLIFSLSAKSLFSNDAQADNSVYIGSLKDLVIATQKTRGLTNSYMNGNIAAMLLVYANRKDMKRAIGVMESLPLASDPIVNTRATGISQSLIKLNRKAFKQEASSVFEQYTELIEQTLMLAQTVSQRGSKELNPVGKELSTIMMEVILPFTENVGQMRGMGSGIVAKKKITKMQEAQMLAIINEIESLSAKLIVDMKTVSAKEKDHFDSSINSKLDAIARTAKNYVSLTKKEILEKKKIDYDADTYFGKGTNLITLLVGIYIIDNKIILEDAKGWI